MFHSRTIINILGILLLVEGVFIILCTPVSLLYHENDSFQLLISGIFTSFVGGVSWILTRKSHKNISTRDSYILVSLGWLLFSLFGAIPFIISGAIPSYTDAFFETMSGFTTTGASILNDVESLSHGILFWRSLTQWLGGLGIIFLSLAVLPIMGIGGSQLFVAEEIGPVPEKLHHRISDTAIRLWIIYILFTMAETLLLWLGKMDLFDAVCHSFTTISTGGFSTKQDSIAYWNSPYIQYVITLFMLIAGTNFTLSYFAIHLRFEKILKNEEFKWYIAFIVGFTLLFTLIMILKMDYPLEHTFRNSLFQVVSIITTTGFITSDYLQWTPVLWVLIVVLMFFGGMSGSTSGSLKIMRVMLIIKNSLLELKRLTHPNAIIPVRFNEKTVHPEIITNILAFVLLYLLTLVAGMVVMSAMGYDLDTSLGSVAASLGNIGSGIGSIGPMENFSKILPLGKWFLCFLMLIGRLELFTVFVLFTSVFWRK